MKNFLRKIKNQKVSKYLIDRIGELVVVILGIIIALQINNWNENRKTKISEKNYLESLLNEFNSNLTRLQKAKNINAGNLDYALEILKYTNPQYSELTAFKFDSLLFGIVLREVQFRPGSGVMYEIISSGKLGIFSNKKLRYEIASWESLIQSVKFQEQEHANTRNDLMMFCSGSINTREALINSFGNVFELSPTKFKVKNELLLQSINFENKVIAFYLTAKYLNEIHYLALENKMKEIVLIIEKELNKAK